MKIAVLSHRGGNIGHDFMALGVDNIIKELTDDSDAEVEHFEQHHHFSVFPKRSPFRFIDRFEHGTLPRIRNFLCQQWVQQLILPFTKKLSQFDIAIACGGPSVVRDVGYSREMCLMFTLLNGAFHYHKVPVVDLSLGACFPLERVPTDADTAFVDVDRKAFDRLFKICSATSVRDRLAKKLLADLGREAELIPCPAFLSAYNWKGLDQSKDREKPLLLINFQQKGANTDWGQKVDLVSWKEQIQQLCEQLKPQFDIEFICHNEPELDIATTQFSDFKTHLPNTTEAYFNVISEASLGMVCRVHAAIPMSSMGIPVLSIGTDTRIWALEEMGVTTRFVKDFDVEEAKEILLTKYENRNEERERLFRLRNEVMKRYLQLIKKYIHE